MFLVFPLTSLLSSYITHIFIFTLVFVYVTSGSSGEVDVIVLRCETIDERNVISSEEEESDGLDSWEVVDSRPWRAQLHSVILIFLS